ncbi:MAG: aspartate--ammonia ligase [Candidatus Woesearchaeota archaeon]
MKTYKPKLDFFETEKGIKLVKDTFEHNLSQSLNLVRVTAPRFLVTGTGLQDDLAGTQTPVAFRTKFRDEDVEIVHSLAKWKRYTLGRHGFKEGHGLYTDMDAIRKDEDVDDIHSVYVDQWDGERVIGTEERSIGFLEDVVRKIYSSITETAEVIHAAFPSLRAYRPKEITFVHCEDAESRYPSLSSTGREHKLAEEYGAVFLIGIGYPLKSGKPHDLRAADYDDWSTETYGGRHGLNGDIIVWDETRGKSLELSSMGIRVDRGSMQRQLDMCGLSYRQELPFHKSVIEDRMPLSIGGGIGQSRLCMLLLQKAHIGEVQSSVWPEFYLKEMEGKGMLIL